MPPSNRGAPCSVQIVTSASVVSGSCTEFDREPHPHAAILGNAAGGNAIRIALAGDDEGAVAFDRPGQRTQLALEFQLLKRETRVARGVGEDGAAVRDVQALDRDPLEVEAELRQRPSHTTGTVEPGREFGPLQPSLRDAPFAAHQRSERKLDPQRAGAHLAALVGSAELDALQHDGRGGKQAGIDGAGDAKIESGQLACPGLELPAIAAPIDKLRPYQRRHQRQDDCNRNTEQRCLHALSTAGLADARAPGGVRRSVRKSLIAKRVGYD